MFGLFKSENKSKDAGELPLSGVRVVEFGGLAPGPFAGMILADFGAEIVRIDKPGSTSQDILCRGKRSIAVSPKTDSGRQIILDLIAKADVVIDPYRPGVLERLKLGPEVIEKVSNGRCILARLTGYRRTGQWAQRAGHDINYTAMSGLLSMFQPYAASVPVPPLNLLGDFAGGGLMCVLGILLALIERGKSGKGQVVEADMVTGIRYLSSFPLMTFLRNSGADMFSEKPGQNLLDGGAPFYTIYPCKDGKFISVGCLEPQFYAEYMEILTRFVPFEKSDGIDSEMHQHDRSKWPRLREYYSRAFLTKTRNEWADIFKATDSCVAPVLEPAEVDVTSEDGFADANFQSESTFVPEVTPKLLRTPARHPLPFYAGVNAPLMLPPGQHTHEILKDLGVDSSKFQKLENSGIISQHKRERPSKL